MGEVVTLTWLGHSYHIVEGLWNCLMEKYGTDVELVCSSGYRVKAHKLMLSMLSPTLKQLLPSHGIKQESPTSLFIELDFDAVDGEDMENLLEFVYRGTTTVSGDKLSAMHAAAKCMGMENVVNELESKQFKVVPKLENAPEVAATTSGRLETQPQQPMRSNQGRRKRKSTPTKITKAEKLDENLDVSVSEVNEEPKKKRSLTRLQTKKSQDSSSNEEFDPANETESSTVDEAEDDDEQDFETVAECSTILTEGSCDVAVEQDGKKTNGDRASLRKPSAIKRKPETVQSATARKRAWRERQPLQKCPHCKYESRDKDCFSSHLAKHDQSTGRYVCNVCGKKFRSTVGFIYHRNTHLNPDDQLKCPQCDYLTPLKSRLSQHMANIHKLDADGNQFSAKFCCTECDFTCMFECQLKLHMIRKHEQERPFKCTECDYSAVMKSDLETHVRIRHLQERKYMCEICGFRSQTKGGYNRHMMTHTGEKPYECNICGKRYAQNQKFKAHQKRHVNDEKPFVCHLCGHACRRKDNLKMHISRIHKSALE